VAVPKRTCLHQWLNSVRRDDKGAASHGCKEVAVGDRIQNQRVGTRLTLPGKNRVALRNVFSHPGRL